MKANPGSNNFLESGQTNNFLKSPAVNPIMKGKSEVSKKKHKLEG